MLHIYENVNAKKSLIGFVRFTFKTHRRPSKNDQKCNRISNNFLTWPIPTAKEEGNLSGKTQNNIIINLNEMHIERSFTQNDSYV